MVFILSGERLELDRIRFGTQTNIARHYGVAQGTISKLAALHGVEYNQWPKKRRHELSMQRRAEHRHHAAVLAIEAATAELNAAIQRLHGTI